MIDHIKNYQILEELQYIKEIYDFEKNCKSHSITENGLKALIVWNKIHGLEDKRGLTMSYPDVITEDEMRAIYMDFQKKKFITNVWSVKMQSEDNLPTIRGYEIFESLKFFTDEKLQKNLKRKEFAKTALNKIFQGVISTVNAMSQQPQTKKKSHKMRRKN